MLSKLFKLFSGLLLLAAALWAGLLFAPKHNGQTYRMKVEKGQGISAVSRKLADDDIVYNRHALLAAAYLTGAHNQLHSGTYRLPANVSAWQILKRLRDGRPDTITVRITEGMRFSQMRNIINNTADIRHDTRGWSDEKLLQEIDADAPGRHPEGLFFPDSYEVDADSSDVQIYRLAYRTMQRRLQAAWDERQSGLPYQNPYELLIMASLIEKETGHEADRRHVAAVFVNRLSIGMRLQTDPTVIYGMGSRYQGRIRRADLQRDTPYNTYTRAGLTPTPIALPGRAALEAAAHPSTAKYLYFVSKMDGSGLSQFSHTLDEHNAAVRKYILKRQ
ncbi:endolytic transglycosylase MltG [Uruburuella testudinis]|uniref:Endolytic murein transglycosylase n=1 Tax=Uruburuella testudinis TaxID=1282863 RepID=A0ABY4DV00_9NEIS|nr:endolytic transglycosylase MltG [Uruburuella testudinis]UOO82676.1 endolytic transglycosylase MltG [Uruburuella testudinis]